MTAGRAQKLSTPSFSGLKKRRLRAAHSKECAAFTCYGRDKLDFLPARCMLRWCRGRVSAGVRTWRRQGDTVVQNSGGNGELPLFCCFVKRQVAKKGGGRLSNATCDGWRRCCTSCSRAPRAGDQKLAHPSHDVPPGRRLPIRPNKGGAEVWSALLCKLALSVSRTGAQANVSVCWQSASSGLHWWPFCRARPVLLL